MKALDMARVDSKCLPLAVPEAAEAYRSPRMALHSRDNRLESERAHTPGKDKDKFPWLVWTGMGSRRGSQRSELTIGGPEYSDGQSLPHYSPCLGAIVIRSVQVIGIQTRHLVFGAQLQSPGE